MLGSTKAEAVERMGEALRLRRLGQLTPDRIDDFRASRRFKGPAPELRTLEDAWGDWEAARSSKKSFDEDRHRWGVLQRYLPPTTGLALLTVRAVDEALGRIRHVRDLSEASVNRFRALLRAMLRLQVDRGEEVGFEPSLIKTTRETARERVLERAEIAAILDHLEAKAKSSPPKEPDRSLWLEECAFAVRLALLTAARAGELGKLTWADVDLRGGAIHFRETKAGGGRTVHLAPEGIEILKAWRARLDGAPRSARVFVTDSKSVGRRFGREAREAGVLDARFHDLRRTSASRMLEAGIDARTVQRITGHKDLAVLLKVYHRASEARRREAVSILGKAFG